MPQYDEFEDEYESENEHDGSDPAGLRKQIKDLKKKLDAASKERDEALKSVSDYRVRDVLNERGLTDKRALRLLKADGIDAADAAAVDAWLGENGDLFGYKPPSDEQDAETEAAYRQIGATEERGIPSGSEAEIVAQFRNAQSQEELLALQQKYAHLSMS